MEVDICSLNKQQLLELNPENIDFLLNKEEILHIFQKLGALWLYSYEAAKNGKAGLHAELKSGRCSDGFLNAKQVIQYDNMCRLFAKQLFLKYKQISVKYEKPTHVVGIPDGATKIGKYVAEFLGAITAEMIKKDGKIMMVSESISEESTLLLVEDFCTRGTGFREAVESALQKKWNIVLGEFVIINRGGLELIEVQGISFIIFALAEHRIKDWDPAECPLCKIGSKRIKPKVTQENWEKIMNSQK